MMYGVRTRMRFDFCVVFCRLAEERAEHRDVAEDRDLRLAVRDAVSHQAADDDGLLVADGELRLRGALRDGNDAELADRRGAGLADLLGELEADLVRFVQVRRDLDLRADVLARRREAAAEAEAAEPAERAVPVAPRRAC